MSETVSPSTGMICSRCHAHVSATTQAIACPACGGSLIAHPYLDSLNAQPTSVDRRGIILPQRHAVGGVITPR